MKARPATGLDALMADMLEAYHFEWLVSMVSDVTPLIKHIMQFLGCTLCPDCYV